MPRYDYVCHSCMKIIEVSHGMNDRLKECPECGSPHVERLISAPEIIFKGSGFHATDYRKGMDTLDDDRAYTHLDTSEEGDVQDED